MGSDVSGGRAAIVASAVRNFNEVGYHATSIRDIARGAQVTTAAIYHHFASKHEILTEIMVAALRDSIASTRRAALAAGGAPDAQLHAVVRAWVMFHTTRQPDARVGASELRSLEPAGRSLVVALRDEQEDLFHDIVERGVASGEFVVEYPRDATRGIINMGQSVCGWWRSDGPLTPEQLAARYADFALVLMQHTPKAHY